MFSRSTHRRYGFTLVELLVVIGIIAVLISILLPSMYKARRSAASAQCLSNLRQVGALLMVYATENRDYLLIGHKSSPYTSFYIYQKPGAPTDVDAYQLFGGLLYSGLLKAPPVFYCPIQEDPQFQYNTTLNDWAPGISTIRAGYVTRPVVKWVNDAWPTAANNGGVPGCKKVSKLKNVAIAADATGIPNNSSTRIKYMPHINGLNVLYNDRSAKTVVMDKQIKDRIELIANDTGAQPMTRYLNPTDSVNDPGLWEMFDKH